MIMQYTWDNLINLAEIVDGDFPFTACSDDHFYAKFIKGQKELDNTKNLPNYIAINDTLETLIKDWGSGAHDTGFNPFVASHKHKVTTVLHSEFRDVPLYINHEMLLIRKICEWRLGIGK